VASSLLAGPGLIATSTAALAQQQCGPDTPEAWLRPGGYCDSIGAGKSLTGPVDPGCVPRVQEASLVGLKTGDRVRVAGVITCGYDPCNTTLKFDTLAMPAGDRLRVAIC